MGECGEPLAIRGVFDPVRKGIEDEIAHGATIIVNEARTKRVERGCRRARAYILSLEKEGPARGLLSQAGASIAESRMPSLQTAVPS